MTPFASSATATVNAIADRLGKLQVEECAVRAAANRSEAATQQSASEEALTVDVIEMVAGLRQSTLSNVSTRFRQRLLDECTKVEASTEYAVLLGRCFNLSINLKILSQSTVLDPMIAGRVISDLSVLENSMKLRRDRKEEIKSDLVVVNSLMTGLKLNRASRATTGRPRLGFL
jgi:hypothetical protein